MPRSAEGSRSVVAMMAEVVSAYVAKNPVPAAQLPRLLGDVYATLQELSGETRVSPNPDIAHPTTVQIAKSVTPDALISFINGKPYKTLKRHLADYGFNPASYRTRYGLPSDYPMVAANYAFRRSELAKSIGLGLALSADGLPVAASRGKDIATRTVRGTEVRH